MSTMDESADEGGPKGPSGVLEGTGVSLAEAAGYLRRFSESEMSRGAPNEHLLERLRSEDGRLELADEVLSFCTPEVAAGDVLYTWLTGGASPFDPATLKAANVEQQSAKESIKRASSRVNRRLGDVKKARVAVEKAQASVSQAEERLRLAEADVKASQAYEKALVYYELAQHFGKVVAPMFAMGPAWTLLRALSAHASKEVLDINCWLMSGEDREYIEAEYVKNREAETQTMMATLDFFSGDAEFEENLRHAIAAVCRDSGKRRAELEKSGRKERSKFKRKTEVHPQARVDSDEVVEGLRRAS